MWSWSCLADRALSLVLEGYKTTIHVRVTSHFFRKKNFFCKTLPKPTCGVVGAVGTTLPLPQGGVALDQQLLPRHPEDVHQAEREQHPTGQLLRLLLVGRVVIGGSQKHIILWGEWIYLIHNMLIIHRLL